MSEPKITIEVAPNNSAKEEYKFKVVVVGDSSVGKTNLIKRFINDTFNKDSKATVGVEFLSKTYLINQEVFKIEIWDTAGQERYKAITTTYYKGAKGALIVYDITRKETFDSVDRWISELNNSGDKNMTMLLIGNKCDLDSQRQVTKEQGEEKAKAFKVAFLETSASSGENLDVAFEMIMKEVYNKCKNEIEEDDGMEEMHMGQEIDLTKQQPKVKRSCCD